MHERSTTIYERRWEDLSSANPETRLSRITRKPILFGNHFVVFGRMKSFHICLWGCNGKIFRLHIFTWHSRYEFTALYFNMSALHFKFGSLKRITVCVIRVMGAPICTLKYSKWNRGIRKDELTCPHYLPLFVMSKKCLKQVLFIPKRPITKMTYQKKRNRVSKYSIIHMKYNESAY